MEARSERTEVTQDMVVEGNSAPHGIDILPGHITSETRRMIEVFPPDQRDTESYSQISSEFFG